MPDETTVRVALRVRPFNEREIAQNSRECVQCYSEHSQISTCEKYFSFDHVFDPSASQDTVYELCAQPLLEKLFSGYNCTIFAYGQTGSGKTFTMGTEETKDSIRSDRRGVVPRIISDIFAQIQSSDMFVVVVSMLEIYEEKLHDLLAPPTAIRPQLKIRESKGVVFVQELSSHRVVDLASAMAELEKGCQSRSIGETAMNNKSSRSHAVFTINIEKKASDAQELCFTSKLHLVDLAGSERLKKTQSEGERMREGIKINEGLLALGNVISALTEQGSTSRHIPYRDSKVTRLLQDSLGGNSYTVMVACVSPAETNAEETLATLRYADRAKNIKNTPIVNIDPSMETIHRLKSELEIARAEIALLSRSRGISEATSSCEAARYEDVLKKHSDFCKLNVRFAEAVAENTQFVEQLLIAEQKIESLKEAIFKARAMLEDVNCTSHNSDILKILDISQLETSDNGEIVGSHERAVEDSDDGEEVCVDQEYPGKFVEKQTALSREMACILQEIKDKERAFDATTASQAEIQRMRAKYAAEMEGLQSKLAALESERNELVAKLKGSAAHHKLSEERRKRLMELEKEVNLYKKRLAEIKRMEKENSNLQQKAKKLNEELMDLKKLRVKMSKQLKDEEIKFRQWKQKSDRELMQIKSRERKREIGIAKEKQISTLQLAVYRRKYEEANACNRRLQQQLSRCGTNRSNLLDDDQRKAHLDDEISMALSAAEAQVHCKVLIDHRKALSQQQTMLKAKLKRLESEPPSKRRTGETRTSIANQSEVLSLEVQIANLDREIELRGIELNDIRAKCVKAVSEDRAEQRWKVYRSLPDARTALQYIFTRTIDMRREGFEREIITEEMKRKMEEERKEQSEILENVRNEFRETRSTVEALRKALAHAEFANAQRERDLILVWNYLADGRSDVPQEMHKYLESATNDSKTIVKLRETVDNQQSLIQALQDKSGNKRDRLRTNAIAGEFSNATDKRKVLQEKVVEPQMEASASSYMQLRARDPSIHQLYRSHLTLDDGEVEDSVECNVNDKTYFPTPKRSSRSRRSQAADRKSIKAYERIFGRDSNVPTNAEFNNNDSRGDANSALQTSKIQIDNSSKEGSLSYAIADINVIDQSLPSSLLGAGRGIGSKQLFDQPI